LVGSTLRNSFTHPNASRAMNPTSPALKGAEDLFALVVAGDIGGTNSRLTLYNVPARAVVKDGLKAPGDELFVKKYKNDDFKSFTDVMKKFVEDAEIDTGVKVKGHVSACCLAAAGPVAGNKVKMTNRGSWVIDGGLLEHELRITRVRLINDFVAQGYGILTLDHDTEVEVIQKAEIVPGAPKVCIGAGTGLGQCFLTAPDATSFYEVFPSEGGHAEFAPRFGTTNVQDEEAKLLRFLLAKFKAKHRVSVERIISGPGIQNVYEFFANEYPKEVGKKVHEKFKAAAEKGAVVSEHAGTPKKPGDKICNRVMHMFSRAYGAEAGVACLKWMPFGGLYLVGGITPKNMGWIQGADGPFLTAFHDKGRVAGFLKGVPIYAPKVADMGERGAHLAAVKLLAGVESCGVPDKAAYRSPQHDAAGGSAVREGAGLTALKDAGKLETSLRGAKAGTPRGSGGRKSS